MSQEMESFVEDFKVFSTIMKAKLGSKDIGTYDIGNVIALYGTYKNNLQKKKYFNKGNNYKKNGLATSKQKELIRKMGLVGKEIAEDEIDRLTVDDASALI